MSRSGKLLITVLSLILCMTVSIGLAVAYFTDYEDARGGAILHLTGQTELTEDVDDTGKTISISNVGEADMVVRVMIIGDSDHMGEVTLGSDWSGPDADGWYYYDKVLKGSTNGTGDSTSEMKTSRILTSS